MLPACNAALLRAKPGTPRSLGGIRRCFAAQWAQDGKLIGERDGGVVATRSFGDSIWGVPAARMAEENMHAVAAVVICVPLVCQLGGNGPN
jgi:hypothetical protein